MSDVNKKKNILLYVSGSVSCFKACSLISMLVKNNYDVQVVASKDSLNFVGKSSLEGLSHHKVHTDMFNDENVVLCASSAYDKKFYLNEDFSKLPDEIKDELKIMCVLFTEEVGGVLKLVFDEDGSLLFTTEADEDDLLYDDIACGMYIKKMQYEKRELLESVEMFYKVFFLRE